LRTVRRQEIDPVTGRYIQSDPIGFDGGVNTYLYVGGNPVVRVDESGEYWSLNIKNQRAFSFLTTVIRPTLYSMCGKYNSTAAEQLLLGTAVHESENFSYRRQEGYSLYGDGGGFGVYQIQYNAFTTINDNPNKEIIIDMFAWFDYSDKYNLIYNDSYSTAIARLQYWMAPAPLPPANDLYAQARYWAKYYNKGKNREAKIKDYIKDWRRYVNAF